MFTTGRNFRRVVACVALVLVCVGVGVLALSDASSSATLASPDAAEQYVGGRWTWWACAALAVLTTAACASGNVLGCLSGLLSYSQAC